MDTTARREPWPRLVLTIPPETFVALRDLARRNYRDPKREALRLLADGLESERRQPVGAAR